MTVHVVLPARRSAAPGQWVSWCTNPGCRQGFHGESPEAAYAAAKAHAAVDAARDASR